MAVIPPQTKSFHSAPVPFHCLPPELLILISEHLLSCTKSSLSLVPLTLVCQYFYWCLKSYSPFWTNIHINLLTLEAHAGDAVLANFIQKLNRTLNYSQDKQFALTVSLLRSSSDLDGSIGSPLYDAFIKDLYRKTLPFCRELTIKSSLWLDMETLTGFIEWYIRDKQTAIPTLESLHVLYNPANTVEAFAPPNALPLWRNGGISPLIMMESPGSTIPSEPLYPFLKDITIDNITHSWSLLTLSGLQTFRLLNIPSHNSPSHTEIRRLLLSNSETLTELELSNVSVSDIETIGGQFTLPNVKVLTIGFAHPNDLVWASQMLDLPALEELVVEDHTERLDSEQTIRGYGVLMRCFPVDRIRRLVLRRSVVPPTSDDVVLLRNTHTWLLLTRFRNLTDLEISYPESLISELLSLFSGLGGSYVERW
ncbi:hypothetical protein AAF712_010180 [Marasmius tenuissimus]|uniref:F-box domain-containing protein n=1 Tax=Marasmius tenuissimus TaxID=585030 RepID=A0ABR2ZP47_9AGAR